MSQSNKNERNLFGNVGFFDDLFPYVGFLQFILNFFSVTLEVFFRRRMGERYFNIINWFAGNITFGFWVGIVGGLATLSSGASNAFGSQASSDSSTGIWVLVLIWFAYNVMSGIHFVQQWWLRRIDESMHSLYLGDSVFIGLAKIIIVPISGVASIFARLISVLFPASYRRDLDRILPVFDDPYALAYRSLEGFACVILALFLMSMGYSVPAGWLIFSAIGLLLSVNMTWELERHEFLDLRDRMIEAEEMKLALNDSSSRFHIKKEKRDFVFRALEKAKTEPVVYSALGEVISPSVKDVLDEMIKEEEQAEQSTTSNRTSAIKVNPKKDPSEDMDSSGLSVKTPGSVADAMASLDDDDV